MEPDNLQKFSLGGEDFWEVSNKSALVVEGYIFDDWQVEVSKTRLGGKVHDLV